MSNEGFIITMQWISSILFLWNLFLLLAMPYRWRWDGAHVIFMRAMSWAFIIVWTSVLLWTP